jgi:hypothetical protein
MEGAIADFTICPRADLAVDDLKTLRASATVYHCSQCGCEIRVTLDSVGILLCANCYNNKAWEEAGMKTAELALKPGDLIVYQWKRGTLVSIDSPNCVVQMDGARACEVVPLYCVKKPSIYVCDYKWCQGHTSQSDSCEPRTTKRPSDFSLEDLLAKISGFRERLQEDDLPMLSKASVLAQIVTAQQLTRIADALERMVR